MEHNIGKQKRDALLNAKKNGWDRVDTARSGHRQLLPGIQDLSGPGQDGAELRDIHRGAGPGRGLRPL